jgi:L-2-hydroxyglutarate oxidase LhgO
MEKVDILIVGAGIVGLALAERLSRSYQDILVVEKESSFGQHCSSRNSEVIHSGVYYPQNTLKTRLCVRGNVMLYDFLKRHEIPHRQCGKIIVATEEGEIPILESLLENGKENGVSGLELLSADDVQKMEPVCRSCGGLWIPTTGIMDTHGVMKKLEFLARENGVMISYSNEVTDIARQKQEYAVSFKGGEVGVLARVVINSTGLWSESLSSLAGIDSVNYGYRLHWSKGEYYKTSRYKDLEHLIYPVPNPKGSSLGIHTVINLNGELSFGPNAFYVDTLDYGVDDSYHDEFFNSIKTYMDIDFDDVWPDSSGIRPKLQGPGEEERDFIISDEKDKGYPNFINLIGIESPGLTCCLSIAEYVETLIE